MANERNRTGDMEETNDDEDSGPEDSEQEDSELEDSEQESASDMDVDKPGTSYSRNVIILN